MIPDNVFKSPILLQKPLFHPITPSRKLYHSIPQYPSPPPITPLTSPIRPLHPCVPYIPQSHPINLIILISPSLLIPSFHRELGNNQISVINNGVFTGLTALTDLYDPRPRLQGPNLASEASVPPFPLYPDPSSQEPPYPPIAHQTPCSQVP